MTSVARRVMVALACVLLPVVGFAQEATIAGAVTDSTGAVLPGAVVTVVHDATGNTFQGVADERGAYRLPVRVGALTVTVELQGFGTGVRKVQLLVGQAASINFQLSPSSVQETVTVTSEAPLIEVTQSKLGGNIDPRQMQELPVNGRNWMDLATLAPGSRANESADTGPVAGTSRRDFQVNIDGQQVTSNLVPTTSQPRVSRDAIAEFQFVASRFDATQGRSSGVQVNAVTKSGTNTPSGTFSGYFRNDAFNAADFIQDEVLPYSNQQISATFGGPLLRDRLHFFANYEYEREPRTDAFNTPYPGFNFDLSGTRRGDLAGVRLDYQVAPNTRWMVRSNLFKDDQPYDMAGGATNHPASTALNKTRMTEVFSSMTQVLGNRAVNEARVGWHSLYYTNTNYTHWENHPARAQGITTGSPRITFRGFAISGNANQPQRLGHDIYSVRDDFSYAFSKGGSHALRMGGEFLFYDHALLNCRNCMGIIDAQGGPVPANIEALFPVWDDPDTWNLAALSPIVRLVPDRDRQLQVQPEAEGRRRMGAGRLAGHRPPDAQPRPPLRRRARRVGQRHGHRAVAGGGPARRHEQHRSAPRLRVYAEPPDRASRRLRLLLRRGAEQHLVVHAVVCQHRECRAVERRPARLRGQPVQRADAELRGSAAAPLPERAGTNLPAAERQHDRAAAGVCARAVQLSNLVRDAAPVRRGDGPRGGLRLTRAAGTSGSARGTTRS